MTASPLTRRQWLVLGATGAGALATGHWLRTGQRAGRDVSEIMDVAALLNAPGFPAEGPRNGKVTMLVFSDYACSVCRAVEPDWRAAARDIGSVRIVHRDWPILGPDSLRAARVALAASYQGLYPRLNAALMRDGRHDEDSLRRQVARLGGSWKRVQADLARHGEDIARLLARTAQDALQLGFGGTPGYLIGPIRIAGAASRNQFADAMERARAR